MPVGVGTGGASAPPTLGTIRLVAVGATWMGTLIGAVAIVVASGHRGGVSDGGIDPTFVGLAVDVLAFSSVGAVLTLRLSENRVGLVMMVGAVLMVLTFLGYVLGAVLTATVGVDDPLAALLTLLGGMGVNPTLVVGGGLLALVFPDGRLPGPRWRWPVRAIAAALTVGSLLIATRPGPIADGQGRNPLAIAGIAWLQTIAPLGEVLYAIALFGALVLALAGITIRFRRSRGVEREQLKWFAAASVAVIVLLSLSLTDGSGQTTALSLLAVSSPALLPIAVGIAVLRYKLYSIDRIISRTLAWALVTGLLAAVFVGLVVGLQAFFATLTGGSALAVAVSTLVVASLFQPVRRRIQTGVDRSFDRARYDASQAIAALGTRFRDEINVEDLGGELRTIITSTVAPASVGVWLRKP